MLFYIDSDALKISIAPKRSTNPQISRHQVFLHIIRVAFELNDACTIPEIRRYFRGISSTLSQCHRDRLIFHGRGSLGQLAHAEYQFLASRPRRNSGTVSLIRVAGQRLGVSRAKITKCEVNRAFPEFAALQYRRVTSKLTSVLDEPEIVGFEVS